MDVIDIGLFSSRIDAVCDEMGVVLRRASFSPNIKDRMDFSCALFDAKGQLCAQAAHIPVHLGSMAYAMADIVSQFDWLVGDMLILNDPYLGGTHLPDITVIAPLFAPASTSPVGFVANRAHHANIGAYSPGSMPVSQSLDEEGLLISPVFLIRENWLNQALIKQFADIDRDYSVSDGDLIQGDLQAQVSANKVGLQRLEELVAEKGEAEFIKGLEALNNYGERLARHSLNKIPDGQYEFTDYMDDDGQGNQNIKIRALIKIDSSNVVVNFTGTSRQVAGNINCPLSVAAAAVFYVFRCLMPTHTPACSGSFRPIKILAQEGSLVNALRPAAVAAGNVETSMRLVDVILGALQKAIPDQIPAASYGTMNNVAMGYAASKNQPGWDYYETLGGGMGAGPQGKGLSAVQAHMTNTLNTPVESLEMHYPVRIKRYQIRYGSGGEGFFNGGDGLVREYEFLSPAHVTLLTERRLIQPWGLQGARSGQAGVNTLGEKVLPPKISFQVKEGDSLCVETPGGGGWGKLLGTSA